MSEQASFFDLDAGGEAKREAIRRVDEHANPDWKIQARECVRWVAERRELFTTDAVWYCLHLRGIGTHEPRALGPVMLWAVRQGLCEDSGMPWVYSKREACHQRKIMIYRSRVHV